MANDVDISENDLLRSHPEVLRKLLFDHTTRKNIFWATESYAHMGEGFGFDDEITVEHITGENGCIIQPRAVKAAEVQTQRAKDMAEVFTPSWICNAQNNLVDNEWFGRTDVFNHENDDHTWTPTEAPVTFPEGKTWHDYVLDNRLEVSCGEAPYLVSRYDAVSGQPIHPLNRRIGILDRKLRVVGENTTTSGEWLKAAKDALRSTYGFEWQGDNLLLAREAVFYTFCDYYEAKFSEPVPERSLEGMAYIISWNLWQMDGLRLVIPGSCDKVFKPSLFGDAEKEECPGCKCGTMDHHIGIRCRIRDWRYAGKDEEKQKPYFSTFVLRNNN